MSEPLSNPPGGGSWTWDQKNLVWVPVGAAVIPTENGAQDVPNPQE